MMVSAVLDRVQRHGTLVVILGDSYRMKESAEKQAKGRGKENRPFPQFFP
jgi:hypothetical protein